MDNIAANFGNEGSQQQSAEYDYLLNILEDPHDFASDFNMSDVDKYSEWLRNTILKNGNGSDSFINENAENFGVEIIGMLFYFYNVLNVFKNLQ